MAYKYEIIRDFFKLPAAETIGVVSRVAADSQDRIYVFQRKDPPVLVFERTGKFLGSWGTGEVRDPHGLKIVEDVVYTTDRSDSVVKSFTLDGQMLLSLGKKAFIPTPVVLALLGWPSTRLARSIILRR